MADATILESVKSAMMITGTYMDGAISIYIDEVMSYMADAGVSSDQIAASVGVIARGVNDIWNNGGGNGDLSPYFRDRVSQLALVSSGGVS